MFPRYRDAVIINLGVIVGTFVITLKVTRHYLIDGFNVVHCVHSLEDLIASAAIVSVP